MAGLHSGGYRVVSAVEQATTSRPQPYGSRRPSGIEAEITAAAKDIEPFPGGRASVADGHPRGFRAGPDERELEPSASNTASPGVETWATCCERLRRSAKKRFATRRPRPRERVAPRPPAHTTAAPVPPEAAPPSPPPSPARRAAPA